MGFLESLFGKKPSFEDRVWRTSALKLEDLIGRATDDAVNDDVACLVVYHFSDTGDLLQSRFDEAGVVYERLKRPGTELLENLPVRLGATALGLLHSDEIPDEIQRGQGSRSFGASETPTQVHLAEHFPIPSRDDHVLHLHALLAPGSKFFCYVGLDEPWLAKMLGGSTRELLDRLGMDDSEPLNHAMIGSALRRAQQQLDENRRHLEDYARSCEEWMQSNVSES